MKNTHGSLAALRLLMMVSFLVFATAGDASAAKAGRVVSLEGEAEIGRGGRFTTATAGMEVMVGDTIKTAVPGRVRVVLLDESVLNIGDGSTFIIDEHVYSPDEGNATSYLRLLKGKVRSLVSEYYTDPLASYEVETPTAVSGVRGTEFIVAVSDDGATEVVGLEGRVQVVGTVDPDGESVFVTAGEITSVVEGGYPTKPRAVGSERMRGFMRDLRVRAPAKGASVAFTAPVLGVGSNVPIQETAGPAPLPKPKGKPKPFSKPVPETVEAGPADDRSTPGDALEQPAPVLERRGELEVIFQRAPVRR